LFPVLSDKGKGLFLFVGLPGKPNTRDRGQDAETLHARTLRGLPLARTESLRFRQRNQALYGYYAFGEYDSRKPPSPSWAGAFVKTGFWKCARPPGYRSPSRPFPCLGLRAPRPFSLQRPRPPFSKIPAAIDKILASFLARRDEKTGLYKLFEGKQYWTFYEWAPGLEQKNEAEQVPRVLSGWTRRTTSSCWKRLKPIGTCSSSTEKRNPRLVGNKINRVKKGYPPNFWTGSVSSTRLSPTETASGTIVN